MALEDKFLITGVVGDQAPPRLEINDFIANEKQFALYIQALQAMYSEMKDPRVSYFGVSAIHGRPFQDWNGSPNHEKAFCVHTTNLFPTWHRPYVALIEQIIQSHAARIAETYTVDCDAWKSAAANLRQPFWDWATNSVPPDVIISDETVSIPLPPRGITNNVVNPFFRYRFRDGETSQFGEPFKDWVYTLRHPTSQGKEATSDVGGLKKRLKDVQMDLRYDTCRLFSIDNWDHFSTTGGDGANANTNSLEAVHDKVHAEVGGSGGHMFDIDYAGFDPIFYLHHSQVDRLVSLWNCIHGIWVPEPAADKALIPFWKTQSTYWKSTDIESGTSLNYTYPDFLDGASSDDVSRGISKLHEGSPHSSLLSGESSQTSNSITEWTARVCSKQFEVGGSFSVLIFIGHVPENPSEWHESPSFAGSFDALANNTPEECANCRDHADMVISGYVHLNAHIFRQYDQATLHPEYVIPRLTNDLCWRVLKADGTAAELPSLEVVIMATPLTLPVGAILPVAGEPVHHHGVTRGKSGGSRA
ncbi:hypothetical protein JB92DRAFT_3081218 [Gautieria morchelliformis]|nr:hypothetical protein JB92DRAFT_3081218 [Gautieria morchelliformis]